MLIFDFDEELNSNSSFDNSGQNTSMLEIFGDESNETLVAYTIVYDDNVTPEENITESVTESYTTIGNDSDVTEESLRIGLEYKFYDYFNVTINDSNIESEWKEIISEGKQRTTLLTTLTSTTTESSTTESTTTELTTTTEPTTTTVRTTPYPCSEGNFYCREDKTCIPVEWRCDNTADCWDGSDERNCDQGMIIIKPIKNSHFTLSACKKSSVSIF